VIAQHWQGDYVRQAHIREGKAAGLTQEAIDMILAGDEAQLADAHERAVHRFAAALVAGTKLSDADFAEIESALGRNGVAEGACSVGLLHVGGAGDEGARGTDSTATMRLVVSQGATAMTPEIAPA
jgi:hypothetical protein